jgi:aminopeptidase N
MDLTAAQEKSVQWDFNNVVVQGKSSAALNALESVIGLKTFDAVYRRCLGEYAGKRLGWREFQHVAEQESGQDLDWFFERWARSPEYAGYRIAGQACSNGYCTVRIQKTGTMYMPVTVAARFEDGTEQRAVTERLADEEVLRFLSESPLKTVVIEPDSAVVLAQPLPDLLDRIRALPWTGRAARRWCCFSRHWPGA